MVGLELDYSGSRPDPSFGKAADCIEQCDAERAGALRSAGGHFPGYAVAGQGRGCGYEPIGFDSVEDGVMVVDMQPVPVTLFIISWPLSTRNCGCRRRRCRACP